MNIGKWRAGAAVQMCVVSERLGVCQEYCLGVVGVILCVCVCIEVGGWEKPVECLRFSNLIYISGL